jgi:hypothetical protein
MAGHCAGHSPNPTVRRRLIKLKSNIAAASGVQITTVRTRLRSILRKVGVKRQFDLVRILSGTGMSSMSFSAWWFDAAFAAAQMPVNFAA